TGRSGSRRRTRAGAGHGELTPGDRRGEIDPAPDRLGGHPPAPAPAPAPAPETSTSTSTSMETCPISGDGVPAEQDAPAVRGGPVTTALPGKCPPGCEATTPGASSISLVHTTVCRGRVPCHRSSAAEICTGAPPN